MPINVRNVPKCQKDRECPQMSINVPILPQKWHLKCLKSFSQKGLKQVMPVIKTSKYYHLCSISHLFVFRRFCQVTSFIVLQARDISENVHNWRRFTVGAFPLFDLNSKNYSDASGSAERLFQTAIWIFSSLTPCSESQLRAKKSSSRKKLEGSFWGYKNQKFDWRLFARNRAVEPGCCINWTASDGFSAPDP